MKTIKVADYEDNYKELCQKKVVDWVNDHPNIEIVKITEGEEFSKHIQITIWFYEKVI